MKKTYFISDAHLGSSPIEDSLKREKLLVKWLEQIKQDAEALYLMGDIFDFWYEYKKVVPRGYTRLLGKLAELSDQGLEIHFFIGNHDIWAFDYFKEELGITVHRKPFIKRLNNQSFYLAHGDGLGPGDFTYGILKRIFHNQTLQWLFSRLHPNFAFALAHKWAKHSRESKQNEPAFLHENEWLVEHAHHVLKQQDINFFIFGHRHIAVEMKLSNQSKYVCLGDWIDQFTYAEFDGQDLKIKKFIDTDKEILYVS